MKDKNNSEFSKMSLDELESYRTSHKTLHNTSSEDEDYIVIPDEELGSDRKSTRLNSSHNNQSRMPSSA